MGWINSVYSLLVTFYSLFNSVTVSFNVDWRIPISTSYVRVCMDHFPEQSTITCLPAAPNAHAPPADCRYELQPSRKLHCLASSANSAMSRTEHIENNQDLSTSLIQDWTASASAQAQSTQLILQYITVIEYGPVIFTVTFYSTQCGFCVFW